MGLADLVPSIIWPHKDYEELGKHHGPTDGSSYFPVPCNTLTHMSVVIPNGDKCLELGLLASTNLLLYGHNLQNLILKNTSRKKKNQPSQIP